MTPTLGDVEIWVKQLKSDILEDAYNSFPKNAEEADFISSRSSTTQKRNSLSISEICEDCFLLIVVKNILTTDYNIILTTENNDTSGTDVIKKYLPFSSIA